MASGRPLAYSESSVSETYESTSTSPASVTAVWKALSCHQSGPSAMKARSALWPSTATGTTWRPSATALPTAASTAARSVSGPTVQNRCSTPRPVEGTSGSAMAAGYRR